jgi:hypothetical protein
MQNNPLFNLTRPALPLDLSNPSAPASSPAASLLVKHKLDLYVMSKLNTNAENKAVKERVAM